MKVLEAVRRDPSLQLLVYGPTGTGKSAWAARSPTPCFLVTDDHAVTTIARWAHDPAEAELVRIRDWGDYVEAAKSLNAGAQCTLDDGQPAFRWVFRGQVITCQAVVVDHLGDLQEMLIRKLGGDDEELSKRMWGDIYRLMRGTIKALRVLPVCTVLLAHTTEDIDDQQHRRVVPRLSGQIRSLVGAWCHGVGLARVREEAGGFVHEVCWRLGQVYDTKPAPGFPARCVQTRTPGQTTLGSLLLAQAERCWPGQDVVVPHCPGDSAAFVDPSVDEVQAPQEEVQAQAAGPGKQQVTARRRQA